MFEKPEPVIETPVVVKRFAVFGKPIAHSRSPWIHARFAAQTKTAMSYVPIEADEDSFIAALDAFEAGGGVGANVTLPLKAIAATRCKSLSENARRAGVVNTLTHLSDGGWHGDNTDGTGIVRDITELQELDLRGRRVLVLGAGGAVQGILDALLDAGVSAIVIANRTATKADALADRIGEPHRVTTMYWEDLRDAGVFELIVNGTSAGHHGKSLGLPFSLAAKRTLAYDMNYGRAAVDFLAWGRAAGCEHVCDGAGMLVEQAAEAFRIWHGIRPDARPVYEALHRELQAI
ncbi:MAG TPA: shikimate dehydrogenase [Xanthomonadales bacterium]|nr:shikimate dehydrogenase [Xanthomonadales bacterium]